MDVKKREVKGNFGYKSLIINEKGILTYVQSMDSKTRLRRIVELVYKIPEHFLMKFELNIPNSFY